MVSAFIVTHKESLDHKYGAKVVQAQIVPAIQAYADAVKKRGFQAEVALLGGARNPKNILNTIRQRAKDAYYLVLIGAPDVIPHQELQNPVHGDIDSTIPSDLPYACDHAPSDSVRDFLHPLRAVGRIPDISGESTPRALLKALATAAASKPAKRTVLMPPLALAATEFKDSLGVLVRQALGSNFPVTTSPGPKLTPALLGQRLQLLKCHGDDQQPYFSGGNGAGGPIAIDAGRIVGGVKAGTIVAAACCYGASLYDPLGTQTPDASLPIPNAYLLAGAVAFLGCTGIAWVGERGLEGPDILLRNYLVALGRGATSGDAHLSALRAFLKSAGSLDAVELKSYAQMTLLGDPTLQPVESERWMPGHPESGEDAPSMVDRPEHQRERREEQQRAIVKTLKVATKSKVKALPAPVNEALKKLGLHKGAQIETYAHEPVAGPKPPKAERSHLVRAEHPKQGQRLHVLRERGGALVSHKVLRRG
ncbi:MAG: C25 family cysteine peptidase [Myxococcota bacterium]